MMPTLKIQRTDQRAIMPTRGTKDSACFDLFAVKDVEIKPGQWLRVSTGLVAEIPNDHVLLVFSRSGQGFNSQVTLVNGTGVIDQDYGGVIMVGLRNDGEETYYQPYGKAIAQAMLIYRPFTTIEEVERANVQGERGANGFGSTDAKILPMVPSPHLK
jgi:dUTP pyrophosphatase